MRPGNDRACILIVDTIRVPPGGISVSFSEITASSPPLSESATNPDGRSNRRILTSTSRARPRRRNARSQVIPGPGAPRSSVRATRAPRVRPSRANVSKSVQARKTWSIGAFTISSEVNFIPHETRFDRRHASSDQSSRSASQCPIRKFAIEPFRAALIFGFRPAKISAISSRVTQIASSSSAGSSVISSLVATA